MDQAGTDPYSDYQWGPPPSEPQHVDERGFQSGGSGFPPTSDHLLHRRHLSQHHRREYYHDDEFQSGGGGGGGGGGGEEYYHNYIGPSDGAFGGNSEMGHGQSRSRPYQKRRWSNYDGGNVVKVFVGGVPNTVTEEEVGSFFEGYGSVSEVVLVNDKRSGRQCEYCFVKYATREEADNAIRALHNQYIWPGRVEPIRVKYADEKERIGTYIEKERPGGNELKVYVKGLNKQASKEEIANLFSQYGIVNEVYIMLDEFKQSRGSGFVGFMQRDMAMAAIDALNGTYVMKGCDRPLIVRLADPKKPRNMDPRPGPFHGSIDTPPMASTFCHGSSYPSAENTPIHGGTSISSQLPQPSASHQSLHHRMHAHDSPLPSRPASNKQPQQMTGSTSVRSNSVAASPASAFPSLPESDVVEGIPNCDWSEHIGPSGHKYYYNCVSFESRWDKPEELTVYEQQFRGVCKQETQCWVEEYPVQVTQFKGHPSYQDNFDNAVEHSIENAKVETSPANGQAAFTQ